MKHASAVCFAVVLALLVSFPERVAAQSQAKTSALVILFDPVRAPDVPLDIVTAVSEHRGGSLLTTLGSPTTARFVISDRYSDRHSKGLGSVLDPYSPHALLERYIVLEYEGLPERSLEEVQSKLRQDPSVLWVDFDRPVVFSAVPLDPLYLGQSPPDELSFQWSPPKLRMHAAWDLQRGRAYVGVADLGLEKAHPDLAGNFKPQFSWDYGNSDADVEEYDWSGLNWRGHGTHVAGIIGATANNNLGVAGICWDCALMVAKIFNSNVPSQSATESKAVEAIRDLAVRGAQVINLSFQARWSTSTDCSTALYAQWCLALAAVTDYQVVLVNSAGNVDYLHVPMDAVAPPGSDPRVISVAAIQSNDALASFSHYGSRLDLIAPGMHVLSTFYTGASWNSPYECADSFSTGAQDGYGPCSGTSMAAPHVTGIAALVRSVNPTFDFAQTKRAITSTTNTTLPPHNPPSPSYVDGLRHTVQFGHGLPDAGAAVKSALGISAGKQLNNRLTPLFSLYSSNGADHFYTTVPQMARAAIWGTLKPQGVGGPAYYQTIGPTVPAYPRYPGPACIFSPCPYDPAPAASVYIFSTHVNPLGSPYADSDIVPLFRLSWASTSPGSLRVSHTYTTSSDGVAAFQSVGYKSDGIEGHVWRCQATPQPPMTVKLFRKYNPALDDYAIFPENELGAMLAAGYTLNASQPGANSCFADGHQFIGYAYANLDTDGDGIVDGMEQLLGTCVNGTDLDPSGVPGITYLVSTGTYVPTVSCAKRVAAILFGED